MTEQKRKIADYAATFCVNVAAIGAGIALFSEDKVIAAAVAGLTLVLGCIILWRVYK
ncbi:MAG: hypothetical protein PHN64_09875 [Desulfovibrionaceae bacterium]|nr:hypothetical protein [Desulfovibrionaceae bacterium]